MESLVPEEPLNSAQVALANGIAERVVAAIREDQARTPLKLLQAEMARSFAEALHSDESLLRSLTQFGAGHNRGPPLDDEESAVFDIPQFCRWAKISRSALYGMWESGTGPRHFRAGVAVRISREAAVQWLIDREGASKGESVTDSAA